MYVLIGMLLGSIVTSTHDNREACEGRRVVLAEKNVVAECKSMTNYSTSTGNTYVLPKGNNLYVPHVPTQNN
jgi:hypothetical protein